MDLWLWVKRSSGLIAKGHIFIACILGAACSPRNFAISEVVQMSVEGADGFEKQRDLTLAEKALPAHIMLFEAMATSSPDDTSLRMLLTRLYSSYAFGFLVPHLNTAKTPEEKSMWQAQINSAYENAIAHGSHGLKLEEPACRDLENGSNLSQCTRMISSDIVPEAFWLAFALGGYADTNKDSITAIAKANIAKEFMEKIATVSPQYYHSGADLFLLAYYGSRPKMLGGDPQKATEHFQRIKKSNNDFHPMADVFYAQYVLYQAQDKEQFLRVLRGVLLLPPPKDSSMAFMTELARNQSAQLIARADDLFID